MRKSKRSVDVASEPSIARGDDANGPTIGLRNLDANLCSKNWGRYIPSLPAVFHKSLRINDLRFFCQNLSLRISLLDILWVLCRMYCKIK